MIEELKDFLEQKYGIKRVDHDFNEIILIFDDGSEISFRADGSAGVELNVTAKILVTKSATI
jgi:hypothetical protein